MSFKPPLSLYIHIPWCLQKCPYCDFNSHNQPDVLPEQNYIQALMRDFDYEIENLKALGNNNNRELSSIFIGGGTPSLFSAQSIEQLLLHISQKITFKKDIEITLEANPGTFEAQKFIDFCQAGVNRLSIGIQSLDNSLLKKIGRVHDSTQAKKAIEIALNSGFNSINLDLMYGLPGQSEAQALDDLQQALSYKTQHLSWYQLTLEPNTLFYVQRPKLPTDDSIWQMQSQGQALLAAQGLMQYEVSAYGRPGFESQHNLNYWQFGDYLAIGAGGHGKISAVNHDDELQIQRYWKVKHPKAYLAAADSAQGRAAFLGAETIVARQELPFEFMMNALRLTQGVESRLFYDRTGCALSEIEPILQDLRAQGLLTEQPERLQTTAQGARFLDTVLQRFMV